MRGRTYRGAWLLVALLAITPARLSAQQYAPADPQVPLPYGSTRPEDGGFYTYGKVLLYRQSNPLRQQLVAVRGLYAYDTGGQQISQFIQDFLPANANGTLQPLPPNSFPDPSFDTGVGTDVAQNGGVVVVGGIIIVIPPAPGFGGTGAEPTTLGQFFFRTEVFDVPGLFEQQGFVGSSIPALDVQQLRTRAPYQPGAELGIGWKFRDGSSVSLGWKYLSEVRQRAGATLAPPAQFQDPKMHPGINLEDTFLFSPVYNFPPEYAGADFKVNVQPAQSIGAINPLFENLNLIGVFPQTVFGIWNGASIMTIDFRQRFQQWEIAYREPIWETETYRVNGVVGPRYAWFWEKFKWVTTSMGQTPDGLVIEGPQFVGIYSNITSNRMYGAFVACEQEWYLGHGFAFQLKLDAALFLDSVKQKAKYETAAKYLGMPQNKRSYVEWAVVPELQANLGVMWYPTEFVQIYAGYDAMAFFNTRASPRPIDFDYSSVNPRWTSVNRFIDGWNAGLAITF